MIISYAKNYIFLHCRKTAGSSITGALGVHLGPRDIQLGNWADTIAQGGTYNAQAREIAWQHPAPLLLGALGYSLKTGRPQLDPNTVGRLTRGHFARHGLPGGTHSMAADVRAFDPAHWEKAFKFCLVRNPWSHAVSDYHWRCRVARTRAVGFKEFLHRLQDPDRPDPERLRPPIIRNWDIYTIDGEIAVDHVGRYEDIADEMALLSDRIGLPLDISTSKAKGGLRDTTTPIQDYYDAEGVEIVRALHAEEIETFGYAPFET